MHLPRLNTNRLIPALLLALALGAAPLQAATAAEPNAVLRDVAPQVNPAASNSPEANSNPEANNADDDSETVTDAPVQAPMTGFPPSAPTPNPQVSTTETNFGEIPQNKEPAKTQPASTPNPAAEESPPAPLITVTPSTSLSAPLTDETARKFSGQGDDASGINLHPPGHFTTAEPLNPSAANLLKPDPALPPPVPLAPASPFSLLGVTLNPGSASRMAWSPEDSFSGIAAPSPVLVVHGAKPGPKLCLTAAVHGDEVNGIEVVRHVLYDLDPNQLAGTVIGVPIVNMQGFRRNSRYLADRRDLNRFFPGNSQGSSASRIAASLFNEVIASCQYLVDIHTGSMARTNLPQLRADLTRPKVVELANMLGDIAVLQNKGTKGSLRRAAMDKNIAAVVIEAGEPYTFQEVAIEKSLKAIENLLNQLKMYPYPGQAVETPRYYKSQWIRVKAGGMLFSRATLGQAVSKGDLLGVVTDPITNQSNPIYSPKDAVVLGMALNQVMHPGFAAYHLGIPASINETQQSDAGPEDFGSDAAVPDSLDNH